MSTLPSFEEVARFHGHVCPGLAVGYRVAEAAKSRLGIQRDEDEEIVAVVENDSCAVDAIQVVLGCTFGKGNLIFRDHGKQVYTVYRRSTDEGVRITFRAPAVPQDADREERTRAILTAPVEDVTGVEPAREPAPNHARIEPSEPCAECGERVMQSRLVTRNGRLLCKPCADIEDERRGRALQDDRSPSPER